MKKLDATFNYDTLLELPEDNSSLQHFHRPPKEHGIARKVALPVRVSDFLIEKIQLFAKVVLATGEPVAAIQYEKVAAQVEGNSSLYLLTLSFPLRFTRAPWRFLSTCSVRGGPFTGFRAASFTKN